MAYREEYTDTEVLNPINNPEAVPTRKSLTWEDIMVNVGNVGTAPVPDIEPVNPIAEEPAAEQPAEETVVKPKPEVIEAPKETQAEVIEAEPEEVKAPEPEPEIVITPKDTSRNDNPLSSLPSTEEETQKETEMKTGSAETAEENVPNPVSFQTANNGAFDINAWWQLPEAERNASLSDPRVQAALAGREYQTMNNNVPATAGQGAPTDSRTATDIAAQRRADEMASSGLFGQILQNQRATEGSIAASQTPAARADAEYRGNPLAYDEAAAIAARRRADEEAANALYNQYTADQIAARRRADEAAANDLYNQYSAQQIADQRRADEANANALFDNYTMANDIAAQRRADEANANYQYDLVQANLEDQRKAEALATAQNIVATNASILASQTPEARADAEARTQMSPATSSSWNQEGFEATFNPTQDQIELGRRLGAEAFSQIEADRRRADEAAANRLYDEYRRNNPIAEPVDYNGYTPANPFINAGPVWEPMSPEEWEAQKDAENNPAGSTPSTTTTGSPTVTQTYDYATNLNDMMNWDGSRDFAEAISFWNHELDQMGAREEFDDLLASDMNGSMGFGDMNGLGTNFYDFFFGTDDATGNKLNASPTETTNLTAEEFNERLNDLISRSDAIGNWMNSVQEYLDAHPEMIQRLPPGINNAKDLFAYAFCKKPTGKTKKSGGYSGYGSGYRSYGGGGGYSSGYRSSGYSSGSNATVKNQNLNRVYNIMKNWSF